MDGLGRVLLALLPLAMPLAGCAGPEHQPEELREQAGPEPLLAPLALRAPAQGGQPEPSAATADGRPVPGLYSLTLPVAGGLATGLLAIPPEEPTTLVVVAHGWGTDARAHADDLEDLADAGALAVAMDFRGNRGAFKVQAGVEDTVAVTRSLQELNPGIDRTLLYGWSMGGEIALLAPLHAPPGTFDYLFIGAGVSDLESFWHEAPFARAAIANETGGPPTERPDEYARRSPVRHAEALADTGVARVFLVHGAADWPVPVEHSERMHQALAEAGLPVSFYVVTKDRASVCIPWQCLKPPTPAGHEAPAFRLLEPFIVHRLQRLPDPAEPAVRGTYDADTGEYQPSDVG